MFVGAKGSFSMISSSIGTDYEEWSYEMADGAVLDLALSAEKGVVLCETKGAYISVDASRHVEKDDGTWEYTLTKEDLQAVADAIRFDILEDRFDGEKDGSIAAAVAALAEKREQENQEQQAAAGGSVRQHAGCSGGPGPVRAQHAPGPVCRHAPRR